MDYEDAPRPIPTTREGCLEELRSSQGSVAFWVASIATAITVSVVYQSTAATISSCFVVMYSMSRLIMLGVYLYALLSSIPVTYAEEYADEEEAEDDEAPPRPPATTPPSPQPATNGEAVLRETTIPIPFGRTPQPAQAGWLLCKKAGWDTPAQGLGTLYPESLWPAIADALADGAWSHKRLVQGQTTLVRPAMEWHTICRALVGKGILKEVDNGGGKGYELTADGASLFALQRAINDLSRAPSVSGTATSPTPSPPTM